jgi:TetR/AcrR family acrAB operon transcriptional repressor
VSKIEAIIRRCAEVGELPSDIDAALAAQGLNAFVVGIMHEWVLDPSAYDLASAAPALIDAFLAGLATRPPRTARAMPRVRAKTTIA